MNTIKYKKLIASHVTGQSEKIQGVDASGNPILTLPTEIVKSGGCGYLSLGYLYNRKWYRIAYGTAGNNAKTHSVLLNIGNHYYNSAPLSQLLYIHASGFTEPVIFQLANVGKVISKARILYNNNKQIFLEINLNIGEKNPVYIAYSCNLAFYFQKPVEVNDVPEEGYNVKEFIL